MKSRFWYRCIRQWVKTAKGPLSIQRCARVDRTVDARTWGVVA